MSTARLAPVLAPTPIGPTVTGADVEDAMLACLQQSLPGYVCEIERQHGMEVGAIPTVRGWAITGRALNKLLSDQLPCVVLLAGGINNAPRKEGGVGVYTATFEVEVGVIFNAAWGRESRRCAQIYARAIQLTLEQRPMRALDRPLIVDWRGETYDELDFEASRSYSAAVGSFNVQVREVCWANGGPPPDADAPADPTLPWDDWVQIVQTSTTVIPTNPTG